MERAPRNPAPVPLGVALVPIGSLVGLLAWVLLILPSRDPSFSGTGHLPLIGATTVACIVGSVYGWSWAELERAMVDGIRAALGAALILAVIGILIGTWIAAGVVPALIDWGLSILHPRFFLPTVCAVCSVVSLVSGSSWSTAGTVGVAMVGIGEGLGVPSAMTAGAVVSGAYFGDKLSPMSDTTNLAPAMVGIDVFTHIRHMVATTGPAWVIAMVAYAVLGARGSADAVPARIEEIQATLRAGFDPGVVQLLPLVLTLGLVAWRKPPLPTLMVGAAAGGVLAVAFTPTTVPEVLTAAMSGYRPATGNGTVDELLARGGLLEMGDTILLIGCAMAFGGVMERTGMLRTLADRLLGLARSTGSLVAVTVLTAVGINVVAADQYISLVVPGRMYASAYAARGLHPKNLSRAIEDGGTLTSALVPWNTCGAFMSATLAVATTAYLPYAILNLVNPLVSILYGFTGWTIAPAPRADPTSESVSGPALGGTEPQSDDHCAGGQP